MMKYEISENTFNILYRYFVENGKDISFQEGTDIAKELERLKSFRVTKNPSQAINSANNNENRVYFDVFYGDKVQAKEIGAKWDKEHKLWYAIEGTEVCDRMRMVFEVKEIDSNHRKY